MKKKLFAAATLICCIAMISYNSLAYFTAKETSRNVITSGGIGIEIIEKTKGSDGVELDFPTDEIQNIMPGTAVSKRVSVANVGANEAWIRVKVEISIKDAEGKPLPEKLDIQDKAVPVVDFVVEDGWILGDDDYYYYRKSVPAGKKTELLFREVSFALQMGNEYQNCTTYINVIAQAVQTSNNPIPAGGNVRDVSGWPED